MDGKAPFIQGLSRFKKIFRHIELNIEKQFSLRELASIESMHPTYFSNLFRKYAGIPPMKYIIRKKMEKACHLLLNTNLNISEISASAGFEDVYYFSRLFKKHIGVAPANYRKREIYSVS